jgi:excisionase family DNA binding protein
MKIYKITEASEYLGVSINTLKTLANNGKIKSFKTTGIAGTPRGVKYTKMDLFKVVNYILQEVENAST